MRQQPDFDLCPIGPRQTQSRSDQNPAGGAEQRGVPTVTAAVSALLLLLALGAPAAADGALYVLVPATGLRNGFAYGLTVDYATMEEANRLARSTCANEAKKQGMDADLCKRIEQFKKKCGSVAMDPDERWAGWAVAADKSTAERQAIAACAKGASNCKVTDSLCDTK